MPLLQQTEIDLEAFMVDLGIRWWACLRNARSLGRTKCVMANRAAADLPKAESPADQVLCACAQILRPILGQDLARVDELLPPLNLVSPGEYVAHRRNLEFCGRTTLGFVYRHIVWSDQPLTDKLKLLDEWYEGWIAQLGEAVSGLALLYAVGSELVQLPADATLTKRRLTELERVRAALHQRETEFTGRDFQFDKNLIRNDQIKGQLKSIVFNSFGRGLQQQIVLLRDGEAPDVRGYEPASKLGPRKRALVAQKCALGSFATYDSLFDRNGGIDADRAMEFAHKGERDKLKDLLQAHFVPQPELDMHVRVLCEARSFLSHLNIAWIEYNRLIGAQEVLRSPNQDDNGEDRTDPSHAPVIIPQREIEELDDERRQTVFALVKSLEPPDQLLRLLQLSKIAWRPGLAGPRLLVYAVAANGARQMIENGLSAGAATGAAEWACSLLATSSFGAEFEDFRGGSDKRDLLGAVFKTLVPEWRRSGLTLETSGIPVFRLGQDVQGRPTLADYPRMNAWIHRLEVLQ